MSINKYFLSLSKENQAEIIRIVQFNQSQGWAKANGINLIAYILFPQHFDFIWIDKKYEDISSLIYDYASRLGYYNKTNDSIGQYWRRLEVKLGL